MLHNLAQPHYLFFNDSQRWPVLLDSRHSATRTDIERRVGRLVHRIEIMIVVTTECR